MLTVKEIVQEEASQHFESSEVLCVFFIKGHWKQNLQQIRYKGVYLKFIFDYKRSFNAEQVWKFLISCQWSNNMSYSVNAWSELPLIFTHKLHCVLSKRNSQWGMLQITALHSSYASDFTLNSMFSTFCWMILLFKGNREQERKILLWDTEYTTDHHTFFCLS